MVKKKIVLKKKKKPLKTYREELNDEQYQAVIHNNGPALIIAGAGSGKTRTLTYKVAYMLDNNINPSSIVLVTFTKKAALEMTNRVECLVGAKAKGMYAGTFHHLANVVLRRYAKTMGFTSNFTIMDRSDQTDLMKIILAEAKFDKKKRKRFPKPSQLVNIHSKRVNLAIKLKDTIIREFPQYKKLILEIDKILKLFTKRKRRLNLIDFDDLLVYFLGFLKDDDSSRKFKANIKHIFVDEYQDVNAVQAKIIREISRDATSITVVGDDAQSIYRFRGADFEHMLNFPKKYINTKKFMLETNYRSCPEILNLANISINHNKHQFKKNLRASRSSGEKPLRIPCLNLYQEAELICQQILEYRDQEIPLHEQAILFRSGFHRILIEQELTRNNIPYDVRAGVRFFEQAHMKDILAFLAVIINPTDEIQWTRILIMHQGISTISAQKVIRLLNLEKSGLNPLEKYVSFNLPKKLKGKRVQKVGFKSLARLQKVFRKSVFQSNTNKILSNDKLPSLPDLIEQFTKYLDPMFKEKYKKNYEDRILDLRELMNFAAKYNDISAFLSDILTRYKIRGETIEEGAKLEEEKPLILSTIHQAKGLEWKVVYIISLVEGRLPGSRSIGDIDEIEEERRLFYVACTRAKDYLWLTYPRFTGRRGYDIISTPSRFLEEISENNVYDEVEIEVE